MRNSHRQFFQLCWVVNDLQRAMRQWHETTGIGPFFYVENLKMSDHVYRGRRPGEVEFSVAFANTGPTQIELIVQHNDVSSAFTDSFGLRGSGFHHSGTRPKDYDAELEHYVSQGIAVAHAGTFNGQRFCYLDTRERLGWMVELMELNQDTLEFNKLIEESAMAWDGNEPYRKVTL